jgi:hypothetical protein
MSTGRHSFKLSDVRRAIRAAKSAGLVIARIEVGKDGRIIVATSDGELPPAENGGNPWDEVLKDAR